MAAHSAMALTDSLPDSLASLSKRWQRPAVRDADLVRVCGGRGDAASGRSGDRWEPLGGRRHKKPGLHNWQGYCVGVFCALTICQWLFAAHVCRSTCQHMHSNRAHRLPPCLTLQQLLKAVAFFLGSIVVSRNFGDAFAI